MTDRIGAAQRARSAAMLVSGVTGERAMACANAASDVWRPIVAELRTALAAHLACVLPADHFTEHAAAVMVDGKPPAQWYGWGA